MLLIMIMLCQLMIFAVVASPFGTVVTVLGMILLSVSVSSYFQGLLWEGAGGNSIV